MKLKELLNVVSKFDWIVVGTPNARCYEGDCEDFDVKNLLDKEVLLVHSSPDGVLFITVGEWNVKF